MKFLLDQDIYAVTARYLMAEGHDVVVAAQMGLAQADDFVILQTARDHNRIVVTRDRDFGEIVFVEMGGTGVIYLRVLPSTIKAVH